MDESYRNRHRIAWEQRRAAEAAEREGAAAAAAASSQFPKAQAPQHSRGAASAASPLSPVVSSSPPVALASVPPGEGAAPQSTDEEALNEAAARRLQAEFDALEQVRQPDATYQECLLGASEAAPWAPPSQWGETLGEPSSPLAEEGFNIAGGMRAAAAAARGLLQGGVSSFGGGLVSASSTEALTDDELARRLQQEENRRAQRAAGRPKSGAGMQGGGLLRGAVYSIRSTASSVLASSSAAKFSPSISAFSVLCPTHCLQLDEEAPPSTGAGTGGGPLAPTTVSPRSSSPDVVEIPPPRHPAPDVAAAAAAAGIQVDADEAVLQAAIAQSLVEL
ncbi:uncharacterized protein LOC34621858 [Cyclospora cayetanensis]|uniref:Uncharacterized protein LOC34621858 n=1 Tax=Cyclospora cayetanensis TaxID=88456 RepID=A0A6P6S1F4_9EIME|nr:uncharacterized protein LOC34621858 [Cyclospora cayetanensis]